MASACVNGPGVVDKSRRPSTHVRAGAFTDAPLLTPVIRAVSVASVQLEAPCGELAPTPVGPFVRPRGLVRLTAPLQRSSSTGRALALRPGL